VFDTVGVGGEVTRATGTAAGEHATGLGCSQCFRQGSGRSRCSPSFLPFSYTHI
jgi:hypothetical protein